MRYFLIFFLAWQALPALAQTSVKPYIHANPVIEEAEIGLAPSNWGLGVHGSNFHFYRAYGLTGRYFLSEKIDSLFVKHSMNIETMKKTYPFAHHTSHNPWLLAGARMQLVHRVYMMLAAGGQYNSNPIDIPYKKVSDRA